MLGGKFVSKGQYGCIYTPVLKCKDTPIELDDTSDLTYSKIIKTKYAYSEFLISQRIGKIPTWRNYFVISESICTPSETQTENYKLKCDMIKDISDYKILKMRYGGLPLSRFSTKLESFDFLQFSKHLIEAGALLNLYGVIHRDLHFGNILVDKYNVPRIIDFNLTILYDANVYLRHYHSIGFFQESPDITIINAMELGNYNIDDVITSIIKDKSIINKIQNILGVSKDVMLTKLLDSYNTELHNLDEQAWFKKYWRTMDSWSIGVVILEFYSNLSFSNRYSNTLTSYNKILFPILRKMCEVSPSDRFDCVQALNMLDPKNPIVTGERGRVWLNAL